jgi:steroid delta-isomerase-like uncharacterized protein
LLRILFLRIGEVPPDPTAASVLQRQSVLGTLANRNRTMPTPHQTTGSIAIVARTPIDRGGSTVRGHGDNHLNGDMERAIMITRSRLASPLTTLLLMAGVVLALASCGPNKTTMNQSELNDFAIRYAAAWSSQNPASLAAFYAQDGSLTVNGGAPSVGRAQITATARGFMTAFPDMVVQLDEVRGEGRHAVFRWIWTGTNTGPGGTGKSVRIKGYEEWTFGADGRIADSKGHYDEAEYQRQLKAGAPSGQ